MKESLRITLCQCRKTHDSQQVRLIAVVIQESHGDSRREGEIEGEYFHPIFMDENIEFRTGNSF